MKAYTTILLALIISSCSSNMKNNRHVSNFETPFNCHKDIKSFFKNNSVDYTTKYKSYLKYNNPLQYTKTQRKIRKNIETWIDISQREISIEQMSHNAYFSKIKNVFELENEYSIAASSKQIMKQIETTFFLIKYHRAHYDNLIEVLDIISTQSTLTKQTKDLIKDINSSDIYNIQISHESINLTKEEIIAKLEKVGDELISETYGFNNNFDNYHVTRKFLEEKASQGDSKAKNVLETLQSKNILSDCKVCNTFDLSNRPSILEMKKVIETYNISRVMYLRKLIWREAIITVASRLPNNYLYLFIDKFIERIPKLNNSKIRRFLRGAAIDMRDKSRYFPQIDRIIFSDSNEDNLILLMANINAQSSDNEFLTTFARRVDAQSTWNRLHLWLKNNLPENEQHQKYQLLQSMDKAWVEANNRGPIAQWHAPNKSNTLRFVIDTVFLGAIGYGGVEYFRDEIETVEEITGLDLIKQQELLEISQQALKEVLVDNNAQDTLFNDLQVFDETSISEEAKSKDPQKEEEVTKDPKEVRPKTLKELFEI